MKKTLLALAFVGALMVSCKEKTEDKVDEAVEAVGTEMTETVDSTAAAAGEAMDSAAAKVEDAAAAGAAKVEAAAKEVKEEVKK
ncbi:hypothetical protein [Flavobacterium suncheonense]|uniref:Lipoprotein n=1 Tax=Flavobacterium suncheonense GH29-5 = DSM 17707 TaxID=1121899 RepID=A0A0A2MBJ2_9FLAO|nr:hypothetical protein [Flavobacterium suncheonense]KGO88818.1 hypothetical protein Q764_11330 [Flavobacterium suncheonense GH29-5 = DSM 17707]